MNRSSLKRVRCWTVAALALLAAGCKDEHEFAWLPDGEGLIFRDSTAATGNLVHYDLRRKASRTVVAGDETRTLLPAVSPDGKRFALAQYKTAAGTAKLQVFVHALDGTLLESSPVIEQRDGSQHAGTTPTLLYWSPDGRHLVVGAGNAVAATYDADDNQLRAVTRLELESYFASPATGDGKGFLAKRKVSSDAKRQLFDDYVFVDWDGWETELRSDEPPAALTSNDGPPKMERFVIGARWQEGVLRLGLNEHVVVFDTAGGKITFEVDQAMVAVLANLPEKCGAIPYAGGKFMAMMANEPSEDLRIAVGDGTKSRVVMSGVSLQWFKVSPDERRVGLAVKKKVDGGEERRIIVLDENGEVVADVLREIQTGK